MMNKIILELPDSVYLRLEETIKRTVEEALNRNIDKIHEEPQLLTRKQVATQLRISLPTLRKLELDGKLIPERAGKRVLYNKRTIEYFLKT